jgi:hypothetical protein
MNLVTFHRVLISAAILFFIGYGAWEVAAYMRGGGTSRMLFGLASFAAAALLVFYFKRLRRFLGLRD